MDSCQGPTIQHMETLLSVVVAWVGKVWGEEWIHVYTWLSPFDAHLKLPQYH